jgi:predicted Fe-S protein YdhL (DUF1289 family)
VTPTPPHPVADEPASPCIGVCRLDPAGSFCVGCGRTLDEIARWPRADAREKRAILDRLAARRRPAPEDDRNRATRSGLDEPR